MKHKKNELKQNFMLFSVLVNIDQQKKVLNNYFCKYLAENTIFSN